MHDPGEAPENAIRRGAPVHRPECVRRRDPILDAEIAKPAPRRNDFFGKAIKDRRLPIGGLTLLALAFASLLLAWHLSSLRWAAGLVPLMLVPALFLLAGCWLRPRYRFTEEGVEVSNPTRFLAYRDIQDVFGSPRSPGANFPILLLHEAGFVRLPSTIDASSQELLDFLRSQPLGGRTLEDIPPLFEQFLKQQLMLAPREQIYMFRGSAGRLADHARRYRRIGWPLLALAPVWFLTGRLEPVFMVLGFAALMFGVIFLIGSRFPAALAAGRIKDWDQALLIVTPLGLALRQGDLRGELRWAEVVGLSGRGWRTAIAPDRELRGGLLLKVAGASILLADIYHWPMQYIASLIRRYSGRNGSRVGR
jgi:hypothetical protein